MRSDDALSCNQTSVEYATNLSVDPHSVWYPTGVHELAVHQIPNLKGSKVVANKEQLLFRQILKARDLLIMQSRNARETRARENQIVG